MKLLNVIAYAEFMNETFGCSVLLKQNASHIQMFCKAQRLCEYSAPLVAFVL